eukprot:3569037-Amphidinium_carterae.1
MYATLRSPELCFAVLRYAISAVEMFKGYVCTSSTVVWAFAKTLGIALALIAVRCREHVRDVNSYLPREMREADERCRARQPAIRISPDPGAKMRFLALMQSILCVLMLDRVLSKEGQFEMHRGLIHMDEDNMDAVLAHHEFTMVFFYRNCGKQCRLMERIFEKAAAELLDQDKVYCAKMFLEAVEHKHLQERFEVKLEPALTVIRHGKYHS